MRIRGLLAALLLALHPIAVVAQSDFRTSNSARSFVSFREAAALPAAGAEPNVVREDFIDGSVRVTSSLAAVRVGDGPHAMCLWHVSTQVDALKIDVDEDGEEVAEVDPGLVDSIRSEYEVTSPAPWTMLTAVHCEGGCGDLSAGNNVSALVSEKADGKYVRTLGLLVGAAGSDPSALKGPLVAAMSASSSERSAALGELAGTVAEALRPGPAVSGNQARTTSVWTAKAGSNRVHDFLLAPASGSTCDARLERRGLAFGRRSQAPRSGVPRGDKAVSAADLTTLESRIAARTVRIEFMTRNGVDSCTGYLLTKNIVLTAGHCLLEVEQTTCGLASGDGCSSYTVDVGYRDKSLKPLLSVPAVAGFVHPKWVTWYETPLEERRRTPSPIAFDYGFLRIASHSALEASWPDLVMPAPAGAPRFSLHRVPHHYEKEIPGFAPEPADVLLVSHPNGEPVRAQTCNHCVSTEATDYLAHTCYSQGGTSGSLVWINAANPIPVALHIESVKHCDGVQNKNFIEQTRLQEPIDKEEVLVNACVGGAISLALLRASVGDVRAQIELTSLLDGLLIH